MAIQNPVTILGVDSNGDSEELSTRGSGLPTTDTGFKPSSYDANLTMDGTAQSVALASGVSLGAGRIHVANTGATTEAIRVAFGTSAANAEANLNIAAGAATTGYYIAAIADGIGEAILGVPELATHYAVANAVASDTQVVAITQGV